MNIKALFLATLISFGSFSAFADMAGTNASPAGGGFRSFKRGTAIVLFAGIGGGVLGLSTLSFYGRPEEHTSNITTGALLGVVGGLLYISTSRKQEQPDSWISFSVDPREKENATRMNWVALF